MVTTSRITLARKRRALTLTELASKVGVSAQSLSNYERGRQEPSASTLSRLADVLEFPPDFFFLPETDLIAADDASFRARSKLAAGPRDAALASGRLAVELYEWINERYRLPDPDVPTLNKPDPETVAEMVRARWGLGVVPISNMVHLLESRGIRIFSLPPGYADVDAFSFWHGPIPFILLNTGKTAERSRFDAAHELGHLVLHGEARSLTGPEAESEANAFASAFLMPRRSVVAHMPKSPFVDQILQGRSIWKVAALALTYRLHDLGMLSDWNYRQTCIELGKRGFTKREPGGIQRERSQLFEKVFQSLRSKGSGPQEIARDLRINMELLSDMVFGLVVTGYSGGHYLTKTPRPKLQLVHSSTPGSTAVSRESRRTWGRDSSSSEADARDEM